MAIKKTGTRIQITGEKGFIGRRLTKRLEDEPYNWRGCDLSDGKDCCLRENLEYNRPDIVIHMAAHLFPVNDWDVQAHRSILEYCQETKAHLIYTSSAATYQPDSLYGIQKLYGEVLFKELSKLTILRLFNVYGGGLGVVEQFIQKRRAGVPAVIYGTGTQTRDFIHVDDVVEAIIYTVKKRWKGTTDVGTESAITVRQVAGMLGMDYTYKKVDVGIMDSQAEIAKGFRWRAKKDLQDYLK